MVRYPTLLRRSPCLWCVFQPAGRRVEDNTSLVWSLHYPWQVLPAGPLVPVLVRVMDTFGNTVEETVLATRTAVAPARLVAFTGCRAGLYECNGTVSLDTPLAIVEGFDGTTVLTNGTHPVEQIAFVAAVTEKEGPYLRKSCEHWEAYATDLDEVRVRCSCSFLCVPRPGLALTSCAAVSYVDRSRCWTKRCWKLD